jgi:hypothetical protein
MHQSEYKEKSNSFHLILRAGQVKKESSTGISILKNRFPEIVRQLVQIARPTREFQGKAGRFAIVLVSPASLRTLKANCADTYPSNSEIGRSIVDNWAFHHLREGTTCGLISK